MLKADVKLQQASLWRAGLCPFFSDLFSSGLLMSEKESVTQFKKTKANKQKRVCAVIPLLWKGVLFKRLIISVACFWRFGNTIFRDVCAFETLFMWNIFLLNQRQKYSVSHNPVHRLSPHSCLRFWVFFSLCSFVVSDIVILLKT